MSQRDRKVPASSKQPSQQSIKETVETLDSAINRLRDSILPKQPYLLSVPSDVPYRHSSRFINNWHIGTPFERREEQLQYLSFLPHQDDEEELLRVEGGWWEYQTPSSQDELSPTTVPNSGHNTPLDSTQRKKITLKDYKSKDKLGTPSPPVPDRQDSDIVTASEPSPAKPSKSTDCAPRKSQPEPHNKSSKEVKSKQTTIMGPPPPQLDGPVSPKLATTNNMTDESSRPLKRRKLSSSPDIKAKASSEAKDTNSFPRLLSPTLPSPKRKASLPGLLSPLLPPTLAKAIATPPQSHSHERSNPHQRTDSVRSILAGAIGESSPRSTEKNGRSSGSLGGNRPRSDSPHSTKTNGSLTPNKALAPVKAGALASKSGTLTPPRRSPGPRQRHIIALKYGKKNRKRIEALLKFPPRPPKKLAAPRPNEDVATKSASKIPEAARESPKPKPTSDEGAERIVKAKLNSSTVNVIKRPTTPVPSKSREGAALSPAMAKPSLNTPKKELKSTAMRRVESTDADPATPGDRGRVSTPLATDRGSVPPKPSPAPSSTHSTKDEDRQSWSQSVEKYFRLGRTIKHEGQAISEQDPDPSKSVALLVEAMLCFMMHLATQSSARPTVDPDWKTILPYHIFLYRTSRKIPLLHGLVIQLGAVCRQIIHKYDMDRLVRDPLPDDLGSAPTPGSDGITKNNDDPEKYRKNYLAFREELVQNAKELQTAWMDGSRHMSPELLAREFPKTWAGRNKDYRSRGTEKSTPAKIGIGYYLPLDPASTAYEAVQFALSVLGEWANSEEVDWRPRLEI
jgi:hypothetical protein